MISLVQKFSCRLAVLAIVVSACAPAAQPASAPAPTAPKQPQAPAPAAAPSRPQSLAPPTGAPAPPPVSAGEQPRYGGAVAFAHSLPVLNNLEPLQNTSAATHQVVTGVYSRLLKGEFDVSRKTIIVPDLAESWETSKDGLTMTFRLRKGVRFQNIDPVNGREVTSDDVKYSLERAAYDPASLFQGTYRNVAGFEAPDKYTFVIKMKVFDAEFLSLISANHGWIVPKEVVQKYGNLKTVLIGSGPFILSRWVKDVGVFFKKNPDYYAKELPYVDSYNWLVIVDYQTRLTAFRTGQTCCIAGLLGVEFTNLKKTNPDVVGISLLQNSTIGLGMRATNHLFDDIRIRKALTLAVDRQQHVGIAYEGDGAVRGPIPGQFGGWALSPEEQKRFWPYDPAQAKKLLEEAGYKQGLTLEILYDQPLPNDRALVLQRLMEEYKAVGIAVKPDGNERTAMRRKQDSGDYKDLVLGYDNQGTPESYLTQNFRCGGNKNMMQLCDAKLDKMIDDVASTVDEGERRIKALAVQRFIMENFYYKISFADFNSYTVVHPWVKGFKQVPQGVNPFDLTAIWLAK